MPYTEDEMLMLSGIQHYRFCPRQWALIHIDQQWEDNKLTIEGHLLHEHVDDKEYRQKCGKVISLRSVNIASSQLGLYGVSDIIELRSSKETFNAITHPRYPGFWKPYPIEYKHGSTKNGDEDKLQLMAQAMCIEEQYDIIIEYGFIYYAKTKHREKILFTDELRDIVSSCAIEMHNIYSTGILPMCKYDKKCKNCSLLNKCLPVKPSQTTVSFYLQKNLYEEIT